MRTPFGLSIPAILAVALVCLSSPLSAQEPELDPAPPPIQEAVDPPKAEEPPVAEETAPAQEAEAAGAVGAGAENEEAAPTEEAAEAAAVEDAEAAGQEAAAVHGGHEGAPREGAGHDGHDAHDAHGGGHSTVTLLGREYGGLGQFVLKLTNFLIFALLLALMLKGALSKAFKARALDVEMKLAQSKRDQWEADDQLRELDAKMAGLEGELAGVLEKAEAEAEAEKQRILEAARAEADQLLAQGRAEIELQRRLAEKELRELVARLTVEGAEARISQRVAGGQAAAVMDQAIRRVGGAS
jgi:F-type H+-transporting ATPase subunit b